MILHLNPKLFLIPLVLIGLSVFWYSWQLQAQKEMEIALLNSASKELTAKRPVVYATKDIPEGVEITADALTLTKDLESRIPIGAVTDPHTCVGGLAAYPVKQGTVLLKNVVRKPHFRRQVDDRIKEGYRAVSIPADFNARVAGSITPGSHVDIYCLTKKKGIPVLSDVEIIAISAMPDNPSTNPASVTVLISPDDVTKVLALVAAGRPYLALRNEKDHTPIPTIDSVDRASILFSEKN